jgi:3-deoxy-7-phosphoheptulonate synthase
VAVLAPEATELEVRRLVEGVRLRGFEASVYDVGPGVILLPSVSPEDLDELIGGHRAIERVFIPDTRYCLVRREVEPSGTAVRIGDVVVDEGGFAVVAGPCAVESREQLLATATGVQSAGASILRGGAFKPRTSPYNFQGLGMRGLELLAEARSRTGLPVVSEIMDPHLIEPMYRLVDAFQVGARNMQNFDLLRALGDADKPVIVKRAPSATVEEWLLAAEYILAGGNERVVLCERGIRTFNNTTRYTLDLASVALVKRETHLPVLVDPSHATGDPVLVAPCSLAALALGADGIMVEVHDDPRLALSDGQQSLTIEAFAQLMDSLRRLAPATGRRIASPLHTLSA